jgi:hypothetical protein
MEDKDTFIRIKDREAQKMLLKLAKEDMRTLGNQVAWLTRQEYSRRYSRPNPVVTVGDAEAAQAGLDIVEL